jgi:uncharacterized protein YuzE
MKVTYDPEFNVAYIRFRDKPTEVETIVISDALNLDIGPDGEVYGIELLNANEQLNGDRSGLLQLINDATGKSAEVALPI